MSPRTPPFGWHVSTSADEASAVLRDHLTRTNKPLGALSVRGYDLDIMLTHETDTNVLIGALGRAREWNDHCWHLKVGELLLHRGGSPNILARHLDGLIGAEQFALAARHLQRVEPSQFSPFRHAVWSGLVAEGLGDLLKFEQQIDAVLNMQSDLHHGGFFALAHALNIRGKYDLALELLRRGLPLADATGKQRIHEQELVTIALRDGPDDAERALEGMSSAFPRDSATELEQRAIILMYRGRVSEALDMAAQAAVKAPLNANLYPLLQRAAFTADRREVFDHAIGKLAQLQPRHMAVLMQQLEVLPRGDEHAKQADVLMGKIRKQSEWQFWTAKLLKTYETMDGDAQRDADTRAEHALVSQRSRANMAASFAYFMGNEESDMGAALERLLPFEGRTFHQPGDTATLLRLLIANGRNAEAMALFDSCSQGLKGHATIAPFGMYFDAQNGDHASAQDGWKRYLARAGNEPISAATAPPETITMRYTLSDSAIQLYCVVHNGIEFVEWFLKYYRALGVDHFFIVDNGSDDGTYEMLREQPDVSLHSQPGSFSEAKCGIVWINHLIRRFGRGHWCLHVDIDEALVYEGVDTGRSIKDLTASMDAEGAASLTAFMIDIYPERVDVPSERDPFESSCYIDDDYVLLPYELPPYVFAKGGIRGRISGQNLLMTKAPLVKVNDDFCYTLNNHHHTHLALTQERGAVLHYKFVGDIAGRVDEAIQRGEHYLGARFYRLLKQPLKEGKLKDARSILYEGPGQLRRLGYIIGTQGSELP